MARRTWGAVIAWNFALWAAGVERVSADAAVGVVHLPLPHRHSLPSYRAANNKKQGTQRGRSCGRLRQRGGDGAARAKPTNPTKHHHGDDSTGANEQTAMGSTKPSQSSASRRCDGTNRPTRNSTPTRHDEAFQQTTCQGQRQRTLDFDLQRHCGGEILSARLCLFV